MYSKPSFWIICGYLFWLGIYLGALLVRWYWQ
jgi:hypothetical protein